MNENLDGTLNKYKAKLLAKGYHQQFGFDFNETFSTVVKLATIKVVLTFGLTNKWELQQVDIKN